MIIDDTRTIIGISELPIVSNSSQGYGASPMTQQQVRTRTHASSAIIISIKCRLIIGCILRENSNIKLIRGTVWSIKRIIDLSLLKNYYYVNSACNDQKRIEINISLIIEISKNTKYHFHAYII